MYQSMYKSELAKRAGISERTMSRYIKLQQPALSAIGVSPSTRLLPPRAVRLLCEAWDIDI